MSFFWGWGVLLLNAGLVMAGIAVAILLAVVLFKLNKALDIWLAKNKKD